MEGKYFLRTDHKPNALGEQMITIQYCTQGVPCKKKTGISVKPEYWLGDNVSGKYIKGGPSGHPKADILNMRLVNFKREIDKIIDSILLEKNQVIPVPVLRSILNGTYRRRKKRMVRLILSSLSLTTMKNCTELGRWDILSG